jgi:N-acetylmuramoyl-L-alanine amidase
MKFTKPFRKDSGITRSSKKYGALWILVLWAQSGLASPAPFKVVIDPGHGGTDEGTFYEKNHHRITEKETTLRLAREVARQLRARHISVKLTRDSDKEVPLGERTALANRMKADIFLSIHINSTPALMANPEAEGIETYILNSTSDESSKRLARLENTVLGGSNAEAPSENREVALILRDLTLDANVAESKRLACLVQNQIVHSVSGTYEVNDRGVKQALFHVLLGAEMPSILVEAGFLNHRGDRRFLLSSEGQRTIGTAIARAIEQFRRHKGTREAYLSLNRCRVN